MNWYETPTLVMDVFVLAKTYRLGLACELAGDLVTLPAIEFLREKLA